MKKTPNYYNKSNCISRV